MAYRVMIFIAAFFIAALLIVEQRSEIAGLTRDKLSLTKNLAAVSAELERSLRERVAEQEGRVAYLQELSDAKNDIERLRDGLADSFKRLSVRASCPAVPKADGASGAARQACELDAAAQRDYLRLRERIAEQDAWIGFCHKTILSWGR